VKLIALTLLDLASSKIIIKRPLLRRRLDVFGR
jgi:hypothetical protein